MLETIIKIWRTGQVTKKDLFSAAPPAYRGRLTRDHDKCRRCGSCVSVCPAQALRVENGELTVAYDKCFFCGQCVENCPVQALAHSGDYLLASRDKAGLRDVL